MAATPLSAYWPLQPGWGWVYKEVDDGKRSTSTQTILQDTQRVHGERAFQRFENEDGDESTTLQNISAKGRVQIHRIQDDSMRMTFNPPWVYPKLAQVGQRSSADGSIDMTASPGSLHIKGKYHVEMRLVKMERVRVAAGTFGTVKIQQNMSLSFKLELPDSKYSLSMTSTGYQWLAKGIGIVKETATNHSEENDDGRRKVEDSSFKSALQSYTKP